MRSGRRDDTISTWTDRKYRSPAGARPRLGAALPPGFLGGDGPSVHRHVSCPPRPGGRFQADRAAVDRSRPASASMFHAFPSIERHQCGFRDYAPAPSDLGWQRSPLYSHHQTPPSACRRVPRPDYLDIPFNLGEVKISVVTQEPDVIRVVVQELLNNIIRPPQRGDQDVLTEAFEAHAVLPARHRHVAEVSKFHVAHRRPMGLPRRDGCCSAQQGSLRGRPLQAVGSLMPAIPQCSGPGSEDCVNR